MECMNMCVNLLYVCVCVHIVRACVYLFSPLQISNHITLMKLGVNVMILRSICTFYFSFMSVL
jgi:hypothetical protein